MKIKVVELINKLKELGYDEGTELDIDIINGYSGDNYTLEIDSIENGEWVGNENAIGIILKESADYRKAVARDAVDDIVCDINHVTDKYTR